MSQRSSVGGCLAQIIGLVVIIAIIGLVNSCQQSQSQLIKKARMNNTFTDYQRYLDKYPTGKYSEEAYDALVSLWCAMDFKNFQENPLRADQYGYDRTAINKYEKLYAEYSDPSFRAKIRKKLELKCREQYEIALKMNTLDGWSHYYVHAPEEFIFDSKEQYDILHEKIWGTDNSAWEYACDRNTVSDYEEYERLYPNGKHIKEAEKRVVDLTVDNIFRSDHGALPSMNQTGYGKGSSSTVIVENGTSYVLTVYYSGTDAKRLNIAPHGRQSVVLTSGLYKIAASVNDASVRPFAGTETLTGGEYNVKYYIQTTRY